MAYQEKLWNHYKSDGEKRIGEYLQNRNIRFSYERPVAVVEDNRPRLWYPDFYLDDYHVLIEYLGMNGNRDSKKMNDYKRSVYRSNRFDVIEMFPSDFKADWQYKIDAGIRNTLERRVKHYAARTGYDAGQRARSNLYRQTTFNF